MRYAKISVSPDVWRLLDGQQELREGSLCLHIRGVTSLLLAAPMVQRGVVLSFFLLHALLLPVCILCAFQDLLAPVGTDQSIL